MTLIANAQGRLRGKFTIPSGIPAGAKRVDIEGSASRGNATFTGQGTLNTTTLQQVTTITTWFYNVDPLAQTFTLSRDVQLAGVDLYFTAVGGKVRVQIRETQTGFPTRTILADVTVQQADLRINQWTRILFEAPAWLAADAEYALVVLCDDAVTSCPARSLSQARSTPRQRITPARFQPPEPRKSLFFLMRFSPPVRPSCPRCNSTPGAFRRSLKTLPRRRAMA